MKKINNPVITPAIFNVFGQTVGLRGSSSDHVSLNAINDVIFTPP